MLIHGTFIKLYLGIFQRLSTILSLGRSLESWTSFCGTTQETRESDKREKTTILSYGV